MTEPHSCLIWAHHKYVVFHLVRFTFAVLSSHSHHTGMQKQAKNAILFDILCKFEQRV